MVKISLFIPKKRPEIANFSKILLFGNKVKKLSDLVKLRCVFWCFHYRMKNYTSLSQRKNSTRNKNKYRKKLPLAIR